MSYEATLTEIRQDGMQKWERLDLSKQDQARYIWLAPFQSVSGLSVGASANLVFRKSAHWANWFVLEVL